MNITLKDVAKEAGVSPMTVSRALNQPDLVKADTRNRVLAIAAELGYRPNLLARNLRTQRTSSFGFVLCDLDSRYMQNVYLGAALAADAAGYHISIKVEPSPERMFDVVVDLTRRSAEGLILVLRGEAGELTLIQRVRKLGLPLVVLTPSTIPEPVISLDIDNVNGGFQAVHHLLQEGHTRIAMLGGPPSNLLAKERERGYRMALEGAGFTPDPQMIVACDWNDPIAEGRRGLETLQTRGCSFTALFCQSVPLAIGALIVLRQQGINVPQELSLVAYDDEPAALLQEVPLTVIHQPARELGWEAVQQLVAAVDTSDYRPRRILLKPVLIERASTQRSNVQTP